MLRRVLLALLLVFEIAASACAPLPPVSGNSSTETPVVACVNDISLIDGANSTVILSTSWKPLPFVLTLDNGVRGEIVQTMTAEGLMIESHFTSPGGKAYLGDVQKIEDRVLAFGQILSGYGGKKASYTIFFLRCGDTVFYYFPAQDPLISEDPKA